MAKGFRPVDRDQTFLLAPDMREWLPPEHLVWFVLEVVEQLDTASLRAGYKLGGVGRAAYHPDLLVGLLVYGYCHGVRSSRAIERACHTDVAFRVLCAQDVPDHTVIARFRDRHAEALAGLFDQVLALCARAGLGKVGQVAIDGTKIAANASRGANRKGATLRRLAEEMIADAAATDAAEDQDEARRGGPADRPSPQWRDRSGRKERIKQAIAQLEDQVAEREAPVRRAQQRLAAIEARRDAMIAARQAQQAARDEYRARHGRSKGGIDLVADPFDLRRLNQTVANRKRFLEDITGRTARKAADVRVNLTDPDSRLMTTRSGWIQGYNCHLGVSQDGIILAAAATNNPSDVEHFQPTLRQAQQAVAHMNQATGQHHEMGIVLADAGYFSEDNLSVQGPDRLIAAGKSHDIANTRPSPGKPHGTEQKPRSRDMIHRLREPANAELYKRRGAIVEPKNGHLKDRRGLRQFARRGLQAVNAELKFAAMTTNLLAIYTTRTPG